MSTGCKCLPYCTPPRWQSALSECESCTAHRSLARLLPNCWKFPTMKSQLCTFTTQKLSNVRIRMHHSMSSRITFTSRFYSRLFTETAIAYSECFQIFGSGSGTHSVKVLSENRFPSFWVTLQTDSNYVIPVTWIHTNVPTELASHFVLVNLTGYMSVTDSQTDRDHTICHNSWAPLCFLWCCLIIHVSCK